MIVLLSPRPAVRAVVLPILNAILPIRKRGELEGGEGGGVEAAADGGVEEETGEDGGTEVD